MPSVVLGIPYGVFLLWVSAGFFLASSVLIIKPLLEKKDELMKAFFVWLLGMGLLHLFLGLGLLLNKGSFLHLGIFFGFTGSAYLLRIPFSGIIPKYAGAAFYSVLLTGWAIVFWMVFWPNLHTGETMLKLLFGYMLLTAGLLPGLYFIFKGAALGSREAKIKGIGGGIGIISCCLLADAMVLFWYLEVVFWPEFLMAIAPVILVSAVLFGRRIEIREQSGLK